MINPFDLMKKMGNIKDKLENLHVEDVQETGEAGGGLVKITLNGRLEIVAMELDPIAVDNRDIKMLEDLIIAAHNVASRRVIETLKNKLGAEFGIPGLAGLNI